MLLSDFDYELPDDLIAQEPAFRREKSRMLVVNRTRRGFRDDEFVNFPSCLNSGDVLVLNNTKVFPARLFGKTETGATVEIFLIEKLPDSIWRALARPARRLKPGKRVVFDSNLAGTIVKNLADGGVQIEFDFNGDFYDVLSRVGRTPLPPYIKRSSDGDSRDDRERYQTIYAKSSGAIAAPTAGLHFTDTILDRIRSRGVEIIEITLHVGYGTFEPVRVEELSQHTVQPERYEIDARAAEILNSARDGNRRIVAVGTTTTRALEHAATKYGGFEAVSDIADLTITPGNRFKAVSALLTNFHLPRSSLLILVSTFGGHELIMNAYGHAVASHYRFYSYGDCMFVE